MTLSNVDLNQIKSNKEKVIGLKQTLRAIQQGQVKVIYMADDLDDHILLKITELCRDTGIPLIPVRLNQKEFGRLCQIEVGAAVVALLK
jgi:large subunit ribosomal protein L7A